MCVCVCVCVCVHVHVGMCVYAFVCMRVCVKITHRMTEVPVDIFKNVSCHFSEHFLFGYLEQMIKLQ